MQYKKESLPKEAPGTSFTDQVSLVVPDHSMSLKEILTRFTRNETLPIAHPAQDGEEGILEDTDLEKLKYADLVEKDEYISKMKYIINRHNSKEHSEAQARAQAELDALVKKRVEEQLAANKEP